MLSLPKSADFLPEKVDSDYRFSRYWLHCTRARNRARGTVHKAVETGMLIRPEICSNCSARGNIYHCKTHPVRRQYVGGYS
jgi:hypothetical protein